MISTSQPLQIEPATATDTRSGQRDAARDVGGDAGKQHVSHQRASGAHEGDDDFTSILGIPATELTSSVQKALKGVLARYDEVKRELEVGREREAYLQRLCEGDVVLPVGNRRYLVRELSRILDRSRFEKTMNTFVLMSVANAVNVRAVHGEAAVNRLLCAVAAMLSPSLRASDVVASLNAYEFGIVLALADAPAAGRKAENLAAAVAAVSVEAKGEIIRARPVWGLHNLREDDTPDSVLAAADADLLMRLRHPGT